MNDVFQLILKRADLPDASVFTADEVDRWPGGALDKLVRIGIMRRTANASGVICDECEQGCWIEPTIRDDSRTGEAVGVHFCRRNEDIGRFMVDTARMAQWESHMPGVAKAVAKATKATGGITEEVPERVYFLGTVTADGRSLDLFLARGLTRPDAAAVIAQATRLQASPAPAIVVPAKLPTGDVWGKKVPPIRPLSEIATLTARGMKVDLTGLFHPPSVDEERPWADLPDDPITLDQFMVKYCEKRSKASRQYRRKALLAAARNGTIELPPLALPYKSGQAKKYFTHDLLDAWQGFQDEGVDLPKLLQQAGQR